MSGALLEYDRKRVLEASLTKDKEYIYIVNTVFVLLAVGIFFIPHHVKYYVLPALLASYLFLRFK